MLPGDEKHVPTGEMINTVGKRLNDDEPALSVPSFPLTPQLLDPDPKNTR